MTERKPIPLMIPGRPIPLIPGEDFQVQVTMPEIPCIRCGADLRGKTVALVDPRPGPSVGPDGEPIEPHTVYSAACEDCAQKR